MGAVGAWGRFITDAVRALDGQHDPSFLPRLQLRAATNWSGVRMQAMEELSGENPGRLSGLTFSQHLGQWLSLRNAHAHGSVRQLMGWVDDPSHWRGSDPYASVLQGRYRLWDSDALGGKSEPEQQRMAGATVQSGCARGCLALIVQAVDRLIVDIGRRTTGIGTSRASDCRMYGSTTNCRRYSGAPAPTGTRTGRCGAGLRCTGAQAEY